MGGYDFFLIRATIGLLAGLGVLSLYGTAYSFLASQADRHWHMTPAYSQYLDRMDGMAFPLVVGLLVAMTLCIPKRIIPRDVLLRFSAAIVVLAAGLGAVRGAGTALAFLMALSMILQVAVVAAVLFRPDTLRFERHGLVAQLGSALLHLGFVVFVFDLVILYESRWHIGVFWLATLLMVVGTALSFYAPEIGARTARKPPDGGCPDRA